MTKSCKALSMKNKFYSKNCKRQKNSQNKNYKKYKNLNKNCNNHINSNVLTKMS